jgi:hypothetical protein
MDKYVNTRHELENARYPAVHIAWTRPEDVENAPCSGPDMWIGSAGVWSDGNTKVGEFWVTVGQTSPVGSIHFDINPHGYGSPAGGRFPGVGITERDLQWCGEWAAEMVSRTNCVPEVAKALYELRCARSACEPDPEVLRMVYGWYGPASG